MVCPFEFNDSCKYISTGHFSAKDTERKSADRVLSMQAKWMFERRIQQMWDQMVRSSVRRVRNSIVMYLWLAWTTVYPKLETIVNDQGALWWLIRRGVGDRSKRESRRIGWTIPDWTERS